MVTWFETFTQCSPNPLPADASRRREEESAQVKKEIADAEEAIRAADAAAAAPPPPAAAAGDAAAPGGEAAEEQSIEQLQEAVGSREMQFAPEKGNVLFASAVHGWAFDLRVFARLYARKLGVREPLLQRAAQWPAYHQSP